MFGLIEKIFIVLLTSIVNISNHTKCVSLSNQKCSTQPTLINLRPNEYSQRLPQYPFYDGTRYLVLFGGEKYDFIYNRIRYLIGVKINITYVFSHNYAKTKVDFYDSLLLEKRFTFHDVIRHIKSVWHKDQNHHYYDVFLEKLF